MKVLGVLLIIIGVCLGLYVGVWLMFIGGIVDVIEQVRADTLETMAVAFGVVKIFFAGCMGIGSGAVFACPGVLLLRD